MGQALAELLRGGPEQSRDALRVTLHLVEKSLQRIHRGQKNAMYTTQRSIENKVGAATGWRELLMSVGFRFEPAGNGIPSSVFFPQSDPEERLTRCSASLQALLGLGQSSLHALARLLQVLSYCNLFTLTENAYRDLISINFAKNISGARSRRRCHCCYEKSQLCHRGTRSYITCTCLESIRIT